MCRKFIVRGRVQGVFFRASARDTAATLGLTGWVRNLNDGSVESFACGEAEQLEEYARWLSAGPRLANVTALEEAVASCSLTAGFEIK